MLIGVLSGVTGGVKSDNNFEVALKLPVNVTSLLLVSVAPFAMVLFVMNFLVRACGKSKEIDIKLAIKHQIELYN